MNSQSARFLFLPAVIVMLCGLIPGMAMAQIPVTLPTVSGSPGDSTLASLNVGSLTGSNVTAFQFRIYYNKNIVYLTGVDNTGTLSASNSPTVFADTADGMLSVAWASANPLSGSGALLKINVLFRNPGTTALTTTGASGQTFFFNTDTAAVTNGTITTNPHVSVTGVISTIQLDDSLVTAKDAFGNTLWQYIAPSSVLCSDIADAYGNGHKEVLIGTDQNSFGLVIMLDSTGQEVWQFQTGATGVYWPDSTFNVHVIKVADLDGNGKNEVVAWSQQSPWYPQRLCVLSPTGSLIGDYWNPGYGQMTDSTLVISDLNNDGVKEIVAGSYNNDLGGLNVLFLLEGNNINGQAPPYDGNGPQGTQVWYNDSIPAPVQSIYVVGDMNSDGWKDLEVFLNNGSTVFVSGKTGAFLSSDGIEKSESKIMSFSLSQNYPNPFNPSTTIEYDLPKASYVTLIVYNTLGQRVATLVNGNEIAGSYSVTFDANRYSSGVYFYSLTAGNYTAVKKLIVVK